MKKYFLCSMIIISFASFCSIQVCAHDVPVQPIETIHSKRRKNPLKGSPAVPVIQMLGVSMVAIIAVILFP